MDFREREEEMRRIELKISSHLIDEDIKDHRLIVQPKPL